MEGKAAEMEEEVEGASNGHTGKSALLPGICKLSLNGPTFGLFALR